MAAPLRGLGDFIREERARRDLSLRQLAREAGVSNPYLSQIERGVRKPSAEILQQIARGLRISVEALYVRAGFLEEGQATDPGLRRTSVTRAVEGDELLSAHQKRMLLDLYEEFVAGRTAVTPEATPVADQAEDDVFGEVRSDRTTRADAATAVT